ncbi:hypothetical protein EVAR_100186_1 [Eumeta japonica]|uniref:Uncharacterized protein n=1 Tax=Eumeta variegata TaxID=151549 RepID=A0A4C2AC15_EUMVA|nr:hypothetical protein EVAR_100186_1 [Eumeta japonica]
MGFVVSNKKPPSKSAYCDGRNPTPHGAAHALDRFHHYPLSLHTHNGSKQADLEFICNIIPYGMRFFNHSTIENVPSHTQPTCYRLRVFNSIPPRRPSAGRELLMAIR